MKKTRYAEAIIDGYNVLKPWHSRKPEYALPWEAPTGAHDMYKAGGVHDLDGWAYISVCTGYQFQPRGISAGVAIS